MEDESKIHLNELKEVLINHVCADKKSFFKHQQINEDEINLDEKKEIALRILDASHSRFLSRFGNVLKKEHLEYFESQTSNDTEQNELIKEQLSQLKFNLDHEKVLVKNRRYAAMIKLIEDKDSYFSDHEMERRNPVLYNELIGKFITPAERIKRNRPNAQHDTLVDILLDKIDRDEASEALKNQQLLEEENSRTSFEELEPSDTESSNQGLWGNFDSDNKNSKASTSKLRKRNLDVFITAGERDMLREEFLGIMYNDFLTGRDAEFFDYSQVDSNDEYDDLSEKDHDCEERYFDEESQGSKQSEEKQIAAENDSEDDLDIYMKHIEEHIKRQKNEAFQEEFDDE